VETSDGVKEVLRDTLDLGDRVDDFGPQTALFEGLIEFDSMAIVTVLVALEDRFDIDIEDDEIGAETFETLGSLTLFIEGKVGS
jgi:acyl carrier protein